MPAGSTPAHHKPIRIVVNISGLVGGHTTAFSSPRLSLIDLPCLIVVFDRLSLTKTYDSIFKTQVVVNGLIVVFEPPVVNRVSRRFKVSRGYRQLLLPSLKKVQEESLPRPAWTTYGTSCSAYVRKR